VSVDWSDWEPFEGAPGKPLDEVDRGTAEQYFSDLMAARGRRKGELESLLVRNGVEIAADDAGLQRLNDWYRANVAPGPSDPTRLADRWFAVGLDIGLYLGDAIIARAPNLEWRMFTNGRRDASYQRPVLMGFRGVQNPKYNVDPERLVGTHGHRLVAREEEPPDYFVDLVHTATARA
jgi:hypothetical protein